MPQQKLAASDQSVMAMMVQSIDANTSIMGYISIEEKSRPFVLFSFTEMASIAVASLMLLGAVLGILGKFIVFHRIFYSQSSSPVNVLIFVDQVSQPLEGDSTSAY